MDLLIRSQDKSCLRKLRQAIWISYSELDNWCIECDCDTIGKYKTKERALEVLNEIHSKINPKYFYKTNYLMKPEQMEKMETNLQQKHNADFIVGFASDEIEPLSNDVLIYEMPEE